jgi:hypothetical protein
VEDPAQDEGATADGGRYPVSTSSRRDSELGDQRMLKRSSGTVEVPFFVVLFFL